MFCLSFCHCIIDTENKRKNQVCSSQALPWTTESLPSVKESSIQGINDKKHSCYISMCSWKQARFIMVLGLHSSWGHPFPFSKNSLFLYIWLCFVLTAAQAFSSCGEQGQLSSCGAQASHCSGFCCCWARTLGHSASVAGVPGLLEHKLGRCGTQAHLIQSMWIRDRNHVSCTGRLILYHWATREALPHLFFFLSYVVGIYSVT